MRRTLIAAAALAALTVAATTAGRPAAAAPVEWRPSQGGNGHLYLPVAEPDGLSWVQANLRAAGRGCGWYLATITSRAEDRFVMGLIEGRPELFIDGVLGPWLGAFQKNSRFEKRGAWRWVTDEPFDYTNWADEEPSDEAAGNPKIEPGIEPGASEDVLAYLKRANGRTWNDLNVNAQPHGFVLEYDEARAKRCRQAR